MDFLANVQMGFTAAVDPTNLLFCFIGVFLGTLVGVLPGLGPATTVALLLPMTYVLDPLTGLIMLAGIYYGAQYGGSTTAILLNLPGESSSAVTAIDGHEMARRGRAGVALTAAAIGSFFAGTVGTALVAILGPLLTGLVLSFGSPEYFALILLGFIAVIVLARGSILKAIAMVIVGLLIGMVGTDVNSGISRFWLGVPELRDGVAITALAVGLFGIPEILNNLSNEGTRSARVYSIGRLLPSRDDIRRMVGPILRGSGIGSVLGVLPGGGLSLSTFSAYALEKRVSKNPAEFGQGALEGVAGPEAANNAAAQTSFVPMLTLGLPSHPVMALMLGALVVQGITPGPNVISNNPTLFWGLIASMWIGNLILVLLNLPLVGIWVKLLQVPYNILVPTIVLFSTFGIYSVNESVVHLYAFVAIGALGFILAKLDCEPTPLLLGFVLGPLLEEHLRRSFLMSRGDPMIFLERPIAAGLLFMGVTILLLTTLPKLRAKRQVVFEEAD